MFGVSAALSSRLAKLGLVAFVCLMLQFSLPELKAQCPSPEIDPNAMFKKLPPEKPSTEEPLLPEAGFLTDTHYTNQFFGFGFDLPLTVAGHELMLPVMPERQHVLLALQYEKGQHKGYLMVTAKDPRPGTEVDTPEQREEALKALARIGANHPGEPEPFPIPDFMLRSGRFFYSVRHNGPNYAAQYWTNINNYLVKVVIGTNDQDFLRKAKAAMAQARFYCPQDDGTLLTSSGKPVKVEGSAYSGPTVPTFRVNTALRDEPGKNIPAGEVSNGVYRNPGLGLQYQLPAGWEVAPAGKEDPPADEAALREYEFLHACSQTLLRIAPRSTEVAKADQDPAIVLRALDPNCLSMRTATTLTDKRSLDEVAASLEETGEFGEIATDELLTVFGHLFMIFHGTLATTARGESLGQRLSQSIFATRYDKMVLMWSVLAPSTSALAEVPASVITFDGTPPIELRTSLHAKN